MATDRGIVNGLRMLGADQAADRLEQILADNAALRARVVELEEEDLGATLDSDTLNRLVKVLMAPVEALRRFFPEDAPRRGLTKRCYRAFDGGYAASETKYVFQLIRNWQYHERNFGAASLAALDEALLAYGNEHGLELTRGMRLHKKTVEACEQEWGQQDPDYPLPVVERLLQCPDTYHYSPSNNLTRLPGMRCWGDVVLSYGASEEQRLVDDIAQSPGGGYSLETVHEALEDLRKCYELYLGMREEISAAARDQFHSLREARFGSAPAA